MYIIPDHKYKELILALVVPENLSDEEKIKRYQPLADFLKANSPDKLYRFRSCKERTIKEFDQDIFVFSPAAEMNNDFDGMLYFNSKVS